MRIIIFLCAFLACLSAVFFVDGIKEIKFNFIFIGICLTSFVIFLSGYLIPTRYYENTIKPIIKAEYGNVYEYKYSPMLNEGSFLYNNEKYSIEIIKDIDNNKFVKVTKIDDSDSNIEILNLPLVEK